MNCILCIKYYSGQKVSMSKADDSPFGKKYLAWLFVSVVTVIMVSLALPFPISFVASIIVLLSLSVIRADIAMKKAGMGGIRNWYRSLKSSESVRRGSSYLLDPIKFSCINCGNEHNETACPKCGSKAVRAGR
jgi:hypothetical protein